VSSDLLAWRETEAPREEIPYWRRVSGDEVDFVIERGIKVFPIEVKITGRPRPDDFKGLRVFLNEFGKTAPHAVLLHTGRKVKRLADRIWAISLSAALGTAA